MINLRRLASLTVAMVLLAASSLRAEKPMLVEDNPPLPNTMEEGKAYTFKLTYTDKDGDRIESAQFVNETPTRNAFDYKSTEGNPETGQTLIWTINGLEKGGHSGYFLVKNKAGETVRFPEEGKSYSFSVTNLIDKWLVFGIGAVICLGFLPFIVYLVARSINKQGNPAIAARIGLILGILAAVGLFLYEFIGIYENPLVWGLAGIAALALLIIVATRR